MLISSWLTSVRSCFQTRSRMARRQADHQPTARAAENLELRSLLTGPTLVSVSPNFGNFIEPTGTVLHEQPRELTFRFNPGQTLATATLSGIQIVGSGFDGSFSNGNEIPILPGYVGIGEQPEDVVFRFAESLPDDFYEIRINGSGVGGTALKNTSDEAFNGGVNLTRQFDLDLGATVQAVVPQPVIRQQILSVLNAANLRDGDKVSINDGFRTVVFEFENLSIGNGVTGTNSPVTYNPGNGAPVIAAQLATQINAVMTAGAGATAQASGSTVTITGRAFDVGVTWTTVNAGVFSAVAGGLQQARDTVVVYFNNDTLQTASAQNPAFYQLINTAGTLVGTDDSVQLPQSVEYHAATNKAILKFAAPIATGTFKLKIGSSIESNGTIGTAVNAGKLFSNKDYVSVSMIGDETAANDVDLYRVELVAGAVFTATVDGGTGLDPALRVFNSAGTQISPPGVVNLTGAGGTEVLTYTATATGTYYLGVSSTGNTTYTAATGVGSTGGTTTGSYRVTLHVNTALAINDNNSSYTTATDLGVLAATGQTLTSQIEPQPIAIPKPLGAVDEPGHRNIPLGDNLHGTGPGNAYAPASALRTVQFHFPLTYGVDPQQNILFNQITENQKQRAREILEIYGHLFGFEVAETTNSGMGIITGDIRAAMPSYPITVSLGGGNVYITGVPDWGTSPYGGGWMGITLHEIGHSIGLGHSYDLPSNMGGSQISEDQYPTAHDTLHGRWINPNNANDIDLYRFDVTKAGKVSAEIVAERLTASSPLNAALRLYRQELNGSRTLIAQNDDYYSDDAFISMDLPIGTYFIGVSASGNMDYDPEISDTGFGGSSDGLYQLNLSISSSATSTILDTTGTALDGNADNRPGGDFEFFFRSDSTLLVDKSVTTNLTLSVDTVQTTLRVSDVRMFPAAGPFDVFVENERMTVTAIDVVNKRFTVTRAVGGTTRATHALGSSVRPANSDGTAARPYGLISEALLAAKLGGGNIVRIVGNGGTDNSLATANNNRPFLVGLTDSFAPLEDGSAFEIPKNVMVQIDAGAVIKLKNSVIDVGTSALGDDRSGGALQVLGTTSQRAFLTSYGNDAIGGDSDGVTPGAAAGDWGGMVFRQDSDWRAPDAAANPLLAGIFLNYVNQADISYGGGQAFVGSTQATFSPIHLVTSRPTISNNTVRFSASHAMSANPDSFDDSRGRIGPEIHGNVLTNNTINGIFVRIATAFGQPIDRLNVTARFDDTDIVHVITENLEMVGSPGGSLNGVARIGGRLAIDPGTVVKLSAARIEGMRGSAHLVAEGTPQNPVILTSLLDDRFGAGGTFDTTGNASTTLPSPGDWGGLVFNAVSRGSIDHALIAYGGGETPIAGGFSRFNTIEMHDHATVRVANSVLEFNANGQAADNRDSRGTNSAATIFVRQSQPIVINNVFRNNSGSIIDINANAMISDVKKDYGRTTGALDVGAPFGRSALQPMVQFADNSGPLVRLNRIVNSTSNAAINGMTIRGTTLTAESVWDDTDIVHVLQSEIIVNHHHSLSGLTLKSNPGESLVVKLLGANAGFTADGVLLDIDDRIGGSVYVVGRPNFPVVMTSLRDDSVGASLGLDGFPLTDTNNDGVDLYNNATPSNFTPDGKDDLTGAPFTGAKPDPGNWRSLKFTHNSNDRNVKLLYEAESANNGGLDTNGNPGQAESLGVLAPDYKSGDDNRSLGFELHGNISANSSADVDVYSFRFVGDGTREVWIDLDRTRGAALDAVVELVQANGVVLARSVDNNTRTGLAQPLTKNTFDGDDFYTQNFHDPGMRVVMPSTGGAEGTFFIRVTSNGGLTSGEYQMQVRLRQKDEKAGSTVRYADVRYATNGVEILGLPFHSPLLGESGELLNGNGNESSNDSPGSAVQLGNLLQSDQATFSVAGRMQSATDQDFFQFNVDYATTIFGGDIQAIAGVNGGDKTWSTVFDLDYANGLTRTDSNMVVWKYSAGTGSAIPILIGRESNIIDDQPGIGQGNDLDDLTRGTVGKLDPFIGPVQLPTGIPGKTTNYQVSVMTNQQLLTQLNQTYQSAAFNRLVRLEPVNSVTRVIEDHMGFQGYNSQEKPILPVDMGDAVPTAPEGLINVTSTVGLSTNVRAFDLSDVPMFVSSANRLRTYNPYFGQATLDISALSGAGNLATQDIVMRSDGTLWGYQRIDRANSNDNGTAGRLVRLNPGTGAVTVVGNDNVLGSVPTPDVSNPSGNSTPGFSELTFTDEVDALAWERSGGTGNAAQYALYYSVRENGATGGGSINSKLYRANPDTGSVAKDASNQIGVRGDIQYAGVSFASGDVTVMDGSGDGSFATIHVEARAAGTAGNGITVTTSTGGANANISVLANAAAGTIAMNIGTTATAQQIVDAINSDATARTMVTAGLTAGSAGEVAAAAPGTVTGTTLVGGAQGAAGILKGNVTGMAFSNFLGDASLTSNAEFLYGVTSAGEFISINTSNGSATLIRDFRATGFAGLAFTGLALGPQNINNGALKNTLFAMASNGRLFAFDKTGASQAVFNGGASNIATGLSNPTGLAFSPLDFNLWHPTTRQGGEAGHGINPLYDDSRTPDSENSDVVDGQGNTRTQNQQDGGASLYFGLEEYDNGTSPYLNYQDTNSQFGIQTNDFHRDLTAGSIGNNYDLPGGAMGSVFSNSFNLTSNTGTQSAVDRPTLYFNYFLSSEDQNTLAPDGTMRDAARVFISKDGGTNWELLATNNVPLNVAAGNAQGENSVTEIPDFISHSLDADSDNRIQQQVQPLWDNSSSWRQARVDLGNYAGLTGLKLRFDFSTAGTILDLKSGPPFNAGEDTGLVSTDNMTTHPELGGGTINSPLLDLDEYGNLNDPRRGLNNAFEGFYIDDIIIGWTERGEAITAANNTTSVFTVPQDPGDMAPQQILTGPYQVEIRRGYEFGAPGDADKPGIQISTTVDTNRQFVPGADLGLAASAEDFESGSFATLGWQPSQGDSPWRIPNTPFIDPPNGFGGSLGAQSGPISGAQNSTMAVVLNTGTGPLTFKYKFTPETGHDKFQVFIDGIGDGAAAFETSASTGGGFATASVPVIAGSHTFLFKYSKDAGGTPSAIGDGTGVVLDNVVFPNPSVGYFRGDRNILRQQGNFVVENNVIRDVRFDGISVASDVRGQTTQMPFPGTPINFLTTNSERLAPGAVFVNNVIARFGSDGISFAGDSNVAGSGIPAAVPFGKIINNTIVGDNAAGTIGIRVSNNASPTLLNNLIVNTTTGISVDGSSSSTIVARTYFRGTGTRVVGAASGNEILDNAANLLFVNAGADNYYLAGDTNPLDGIFDGALPIDRSLKSLADRTNYLAVKTDLGIPASDIVSPTRDAFGQLRVDDPQQPPSGVGGEIFNDVGAIERADFNGPYVSIVTPTQDNSTQDLDNALTILHVDRVPLLTQFVINLLDMGIGIDDRSLKSSQFQLLQNGVLLVENTDYLWRYNTNTNSVYLISPSVFAADRIYTIRIDNTANGVLDLAGNRLQANQSNGTTQFVIKVTDGVNDAPVNTIPPLQTLNEDSFKVFSAANGNSITVSDKDAFIGDNRLRITLQAVNGRLSLPASAGLGNLTFTAGSATAGVLDVLKTFEGDITDLNNALNGLRFEPDADYFGPAQIIITTNDRGQFSGPPSLPAETISTVLLTVLPVNDAPSFTLLPVAQVPILTAEDANTWTTIGLPIITNAVPGPPNEASPPVGSGVAPQTVSAVWTVTATTGSWTTTNFFSALNIDAATGLLKFTTNPDVTGTATISIEMVDSLLLHSLPQIITISVSAVNDIPIYTLDPLQGNITDVENQGLKTSPFVSSFAVARATALDELRLPPAGQTATWTPVVNVTSGNLTFDSIQVLPNGRIEYKTTKDKYGTADVTFTLTDNGGLPGVDSAASKLVKFTINEINDKPVNVVPGPQSTNEDTTLVFSGVLGRQIMVSDPDIYLGNNRLKVTLTASHGVMTLNGVGGLTFTTGNGNANAVMVFTGDVAAINLALNGLSFIPEPDYFGPAWIDILTNDQGQFTNAGLPAETDLDRIDIDVVSVNDPPSFNPLAIPLVTVLEDSGPVQVSSFLTGLSGGPANEVQTLTAEFTPTAITSSWTLAEFFTVTPTIVFDSLTPTGKLRFQTAPDVNGSVTFDILVRDFEGLPSGTRSFTIVVDPVNDKPTFDPVPTPPTIPEDAGPQSVPLFVQNASGGPRDESQVLTAEFTVLSTTGSWLPNEFFSVLPTVNLTTGQMTYTVANNVNGTATVAVLLRDSEGLPSDTQTFVVTVTAVNDAPVFNAVVNPPAVNEDAGLRTVNAFVTGQSAGPRDEPATLTSELTVFSVTGSWNTSNFFAAGGAPTVNPVTGVLTYQTAQDVNGAATIRILLRDSAGLPSAVQQFVITVNAENDEPVFTLDPLVVPVSILEDAGLGTYSIVSAFDAARSTALDELGGQTPFTWILGTPVVTAGNLAFDSITMLATGELRFQTRLNTAGTASVTLQLRDSGSATAPNDNLSVPATFQIIVANTNDTPTAETGNYVIDAGESLTLNASASTDPDLPFGDVLTYTWDLNGDGTFETSTGTNSTSTLTWAQLVSAGVTAPAEFNAALKVTDTALKSSTRLFTLRTRTVDYGDAPNTYGTLKASSGAAHELQGTLWLGANVDGDFDGQPNAAASGDGADENGVVFTSLFETTSLVSLATTMNVTASLAGKLDVWLDLNRNGVFDGSEHTNGGTSYNLVAGVNALSVMIPPDALLGTTYMRFRISSSGGLTPTGRIIGGEVEDYAVNVTRLPTPETPVIIKPVDFNLADGNAPITTDLTPRIEWQNNPKNHHFTVVVRNAGGTEVFKRTNVGANQLDVTTTLATGEYTVSVTAFDRAGVAAPTANYTFNVVPIAVSAPAGDIVTHRPIVSWNAVEGSKSYTVEIKSARTGLVVHTVSLNATPGFLPNYNVPTELALGGYTVRVRAVDAADLLGDWSAPSAFNVRTPTTITAPTGTLLNLRPTVTWTPIFSATTYLLVLTNVTDGEEAFRVNGLTTTSWMPPSNLKIADYSVSVRGFNAAGDNSNWSAPRLFRVNQTAVATAPTGRVGTTTPTFNWPLIAGADSFELIINRGYGDNGVEFSQIIPASDSYTLTRALPLGTYTFRFREINFPKNSLTGTEVSTAFSKPYTFIVAAAPTVSSLSPKADPNFDWVTLSNRPTFTWTNPPGAEKSDIWIAQVGGNFQYLRVNGISGTSFTPAQDIGIGTYTIWVRTYSDTDNPATPADERIASNWSQSQQFRVVTQPAPATLARVTTGKPLFAWNAVPGAITYEVWLANDSDLISPFANVSAIATLNYTPTSDLPVGRYSFWVRATNGLVQHSYWSVPFQFEVATAPVLAGPPSSTLVTKPSFTWNNMAVSVGGKTTGADSYDFLLYKVDPVTFKYTALPLVTGLTSPAYTIPTDLAFGQYKAFVRAFVKGRVTTPTLRGVNPTYTEFSNGIAFSVGSGPIVNSIPNSNNRTPTISWQAMHGAGKYDVFIAAGTSTAALVRKNGVTGTSWTVATPLTPGVYRVWVRAISTDGTKMSSWSTPIEWTISSATQPIDPLKSASELIFAVVPPGISELSVTSTTVSLADFVENDYPTGPVRAVEGENDAPIRLPVTQNIELRPVTPPIIAVDENSAEHTDNVLAGWDKQLWWDSSAKNSETLPVSTADSAGQTSKTSSSFGILGALLTLVPKAIRRKRDE